MRFFQIARSEKKVDIPFLRFNRKIGLAGQMWRFLTEFGKTAICCIYIFSV